MANFDLIAFDLDGTVFAEPHNEDIRPRVVRAFEAAHRAGVRISVASGRPVNMLGQTLMSAPWLDWLITVNGASVSSARDGAMVKARMMPRDQVREIVSVVRSIGDGAGKGGWSLFAPNRTCFDAALNEMFSAEMPEEPERENFSFVESVADRWGSVEEVSTVDAALDSLSTDVFKIGCMFASPEELGAARQAVEASPLDGLEMAQVGPTELEITRAGVNKGSALGILCRELSIDESRAVAFGDSGNDETFAQSACTFVAMGNADPHIKAIADDLCPSVKEDGVAVWLEEHL